MQQELLSQLANFSKGVLKYHHTTKEIPQTPFTEFYRDGSTTVQHYTGDGPPLLIVPSLVNTHAIMDLHPEKSFVKFVQEQGFNVFLINWGTPQSAEKDFGINDYLSRLIDIQKQVRTKTNQLPHVAGYCMGGTLSLMMASATPDIVNTLTLLATPWNFHIDAFDFLQNPDLVALLLEKAGAVADTVPIDLLSMLFFYLNPFAAFNKFQSFAKMDENSLKAETFIAVEDWLNQGVPLATTVAVETFLKWYGKNQLHAKAWTYEDNIIDVQNVAAPTLLVQPLKDQIVPKESALCLADEIADVKTLIPNTGHLGLMAGTQSKEEIWHPITEFLQSNS